MTQLKVLALCLLVSAVEGGRVSIARVLEQKVEGKAHSTKTGTLGWFDFDLGTPKICCCQAAAKVTEKCYWQQRIPFDTGSGCNWAGKFNPFANRQHIFGIMDSKDRANMIVFDAQNYSAMEPEYEAQCSSAKGQIARTIGLDEKPHKYVVVEDPEYLLPPKEKKADAGSGAGEFKEYFPAEAVAKKVFQAPTEAAAFATPQLAVDVEAHAEEVITKVSEEAQELVTNSHLKMCMTAFERGVTTGDVLCNVACDPWPPTMGTLKRKDGCHTPLSPSISTAAKYCKKVCSDNNGCESTTSMPENKIDLKTLCPV
jgi:hypothetical protein